jgi:hypothetical protein
LPAAILALAALAAVPAAAQIPGDPVKVDPAAAGKASHLIVDVRGSEDPQAKGRAPQAAVLAATQGFKIDTRARAERCSADQAKAFNCPGASKIGSGTADATVSNGTFSQPIVADIEMFLAPPFVAGDAAGVVVVFKERSSGERGAVNGRIAKTAGAFGVEVRFDDLGSANSAAPQGFTIRLDRLQANVGASRKEKITVCCKTVKRNGVKKKVKYKKNVTRNLITNPRTCDGAWEYQVRVRYSASEESVRDGSVACSG